MEDGSSEQGRPEPFPIGGVRLQILPEFSEVLPEFSEVLSEFSGVLPEFTDVLLENYSENY